MNKASLPSSETMFFFRQQSALQKQIGKETKILHNVQCEVCFVNIPYYQGPEAGIICKDCATPNMSKSGVVRTEPLCILRSAINGEIIA